MANKLPGYGSAVGYWGGDPHCRMTQEQTAAKIRVLLQDQLRTNGRPVWLWQPVQLNTPGIVACTCDKNTTQNADGRCFSCYSARNIPGYLKFLHETLFWASAESSLFTLVGVSLDTTKKPNRLRLNNGVTSGTITTQDKAFANPTSVDWEVELAAFRKIAGDTVALEFSTDAGTTWFTVPLTPTTVAIGGQVFRGTITGLGKPIGSGNVRFRITLTRASGTSAESPSFEIVRARHVQPDHVNPALTRPDMLPGQILVLKTWEVEQAMRAIAQGRVIEHVGDRMQTSPLDFFDITLTMDTPPVALDDRGAGMHPFVEYSTGVRNLQRYAIHNISIDSTFDGLMTHQSFNERRTQDGELYQLVF